MMKFDKHNSELEKYISDIRDVLNEISATEEEKEARLIISRCLDELIVEYMKSKNRE